MPGSAVQAQGIAQIQGRIVRPAAGDTVGVTGVRVVLHGVGRAKQGAVDSVTSGADGRFRFRFAPDSTVVYLLSARYREIEYFSSRITGTEGDTDVRVVVFDTSTTVPIEVRARYLLAGAPDPDEGRSVVDVVVLRNPSSATRLAPDSVTPVWSMALPTGALRTVVDDGSEVSPDAVTIRNDSVLIFAPLGPGSRQLVLTYFFDDATDQVVVPFPIGTDSVTVLVEEPAVRVITPGLRESAEQVAGQPVRSWTGPLPAGAVVTFRFPGPSRAPGWLLGALVALMIGVMAVVGLRRRPRPSGQPAAPDLSVEDLVNAVAALDNAHRDRSPGTDVEREYQSRRAALRRQLDRALARTRASS